MTTITTINPYYDAIKDLDVDDYYGVRSGFYNLSKVDFDKASRLYISRHDYCRIYSWSIPDPTSIQFAAHYLGSKAVEMGAGLGYYAWQLTQVGVDILCYDSHPPDKVTDNHWCSPRTGAYGDLTGETTQTYHPILQGTPEALREHSDRTLFLCWPPMSDMATLCLQHYSGNKLVYIGESDGGCTADESFFHVLEEDWNEIDSHKPLQWDGIHDYIHVYERIQ